MNDRIDLRYGCNPNQKMAYIHRDGGLPVSVLNGKPGYINFLDALNGWQLVSELKAVTGLPAAASFKHVSPAGAAVALPLDESERRMCFISEKTELSPLAAAYVRARGADRMSSFGDFISLSDPCDESTAAIISKEVSDGIIAPGYDASALEILKAKRGGNYTILQIDPYYVPDSIERRTVFGIEFVQDRNSYVPSDDDFCNIVTKRSTMTDDEKRDLKVALVALKYTQSNSVAYAYHGQTIGIGAGQQSRIHCTRLAGDKADRWNLRRTERILSLPFRKGLSRNEKDNAIEQYLSDEPEIDVVSCWQEYFSEKPSRLEREEKAELLSLADGVSLASDAFFPFPDNIDRAHRSRVSAIAEPGGSLRDDLVIKRADEYGMVMAFTSVRLFHH